MLYAKPANMSFTDIAIWIDNNKETEYSTEQFFNYIYCLCEMLTRNKGYFQTDSEKEDFSCYLAQIVYDRYKNENDKPKSVLNYIKSIIKYKKIDYTRDYWQENININSLSGCKKQCYVSELDDKLVEPMGKMLNTEFVVYLNTLGDTIKNKVNSYGIQDSVVRKNILISCYLSFLSATTLPERHIGNIDGICRTQEIREKAVFRKHGQLIKSDFIIPYHIEDNKTRELLNTIVKDIMDTIKEEMTEMVDEQYSLCRCVNDIKSEFLNYLADEDTDADQDNFFTD